jgi:riboflavin synthase
MFTGIIEEVGQVQSVTRQGGIALIGVKACTVLDGTVIGDSIAVNGVCLTVVSKDAASLSFEAVPATLAATTLSIIRSGARINLERSLRVGARVSGHFVTGHIDCKGIIRRKFLSRGAWAFHVAFPAKYMKWVLPKGSIAIDGVSLTIAEIRSAVVVINVIPHTMESTNFKYAQVSSPVNLEFDVLAKKASQGLMR